MSTFHLQIVTPDGGVFDAQAQRLIVRTVTGDVCILPRHINYVTAVGMGEARIIEEDGNVRRAACIGGMLAVTEGEVKLVATTFEWAERIDHDRAKQAEERARAILDAKDKHSEQDLALADAKLKRALVRQGVAHK